MPIRNTQPEKGGCLKKLGCGCLVVVILLIAGSFFVYQNTKAIMAALSSEYTEPAPMELPAAHVPDAELAATSQRWDAFAKAVRSGQGEAAELSLTAREINALIQRSPAWAGKVYVHIENDRIRSDISAPLGDLIKTDSFKGRWLNGSAGFRVSTVGGQPVVFLDSLSVRGKSAPNSFLKAVRSRNLAEDAFNNPKYADVMRRIESIDVLDDRLVIKAK